MTTKEVNTIALEVALQLLNNAYNGRDAFSEEQHEQLWKYLDALNDSLVLLQRRLKSFDGYTTFTVVCSNNIHDYMQKDFGTLDEAEAFAEQQKGKWYDVDIVMSKVERHPRSL